MEVHGQGSSLAVYSTKNFKEAISLTVRVQSLLLQYENTVNEDLICLNNLYHITYILL
jgi:hypothetical protein